MEPITKCIRCRKRFEEHHLEYNCKVNVCFDCLIECLLLIISKLASVRFITAKSSEEKAA